MSRAVLVAVGSTVAVIVFMDWVPYLFGVHPGETSLKAYLEEYGDNLTVLPPFNGHQVVPDVQHTLIHAGLLLCCVLSWRAFVATRRSTVVHPGWNAASGASPAPGSRKGSRP